MFSRYRYAGFLAILTATLAIPTLALNFLAVFVDNPVFKLVNVVTSLVSLLVFYLLMGYLKNFIDYRLQQSGMGFLLVGILVCATLITGVNLASSLMSNMLHALAFSFVALVPSIIAGILQIFVGLKLSKEKEAAHVQLYGYLLIGSGALTASVVFSDMVLFVDLAANIVMALMFFAAAKPQAPVTALPNAA